MSELMFPTEVILLPSRGKFYPVGHPLRDNGGKLELKYMTAKEEDILTNTNLIANQTVVDKLMDSLVIHEGVKYTELTVGDLNATLVASRVLAYGKNYPIEFSCPKCEGTINHVVDLTELETPDELIDVDENGYHKFTTDTGTVVVIKIMTRGDELEVQKNIKAFESKFPKQIAPEVTMRLKRIIVSINDVTDKNELSTLVDNLITRDTKYIRDEFEKINPALDTSMEVECHNCGHVIKGGIPIGIDFLWPDTTI